MKFGNIFVGKRLFVGCGKPKALGKGETEIRGSAYVEGPLQVGNDKQYKKVEATVMIGEEYNEDALIDLPDTPQDIRRGIDRKMRPCDLSVKVKGNVVIEGDDKTANALKIDGDTDQTGNIKASENITTDAHFVGDITKTSGTPPGCKLFDIQHPTKEGHRLAHACIEGPEVAVYTRGRVCNGHNVIELPEYWKGLINYESLTIQLTAIHSHQNVIVKRISPIEGRIYLQSQGGMPVDCFYHIMAERVDVEKLIVEYEGKTPADYPGDNSGYSIAGYNYDVRS